MDMELYINVNQMAHLSMEHLEAMAVARELMAKQIRDRETTSTPTSDEQWMVKLKASISRHDRRLRQEQKTAADKNLKGDLSSEDGNFEEKMEVEKSTNEEREHSRVSVDRDLEINSQKLQKTTIDQSLDQMQNMEQITNTSKLELDLEENALPVQTSANTISFAAMEQIMMSHISTLLKIQSQEIGDKTDAALNDINIRTKDAFQGVADQITGLRKRNNEIRGYVNDVLASNELEINEKQLHGQQQDINPEHEIIINEDMEIRHQRTDAKIVKLAEELKKTEAINAIIRNELETAVFPTALWQSLSHMTDLEAIAALNAHKLKQMEKLKHTINNKTKTTAKAHTQTTTNMRNKNKKHKKKNVGRQITSIITKDIIKFVNEETPPSSGDEISEDSDSNSSQSSSDCSTDDENHHRNEEKQSSLRKRKIDKNGNWFDMDMVHTLAGHRDLVKFDGKYFGKRSMDAVAFIERFDRYRKVCHIPKATARATFGGLYLKGAAYQTYVNCEKSIGKDWSSLKKWFIRKFGGLPNIQQKEEKLKQFQQLDNETPSNTYDRFDNLYNEYKREYRYAKKMKINTVLVRKLRSSDAMAYLINGLSHMTQMVVWTMNSNKPKTYLELEDQLLQADTALYPGERITIQGVSQKPVLNIGRNKASKNTQNTNFSNRFNNNWKNKNANNDRSSFNSNTKSYPNNYKGSNFNPKFLSYRQRQQWSNNKNDNFRKKSINTGFQRRNWNRGRNNNTFNSQRRPWTNNKNGNNWNSKNKDWKTKTFVNQQSSSSGGRPNTETKTETRTCYTCYEDGHISPQCPHRNKSKDEIQKIRNKNHTAMNVNVQPILKPQRNTVYLPQLSADKKSVSWALPRERVSNIEDINMLDMESIQAVDTLESALISLVPPIMIKLNSKELGFIDCMVDTGASISLVDNKKIAHLQPQESYTSFNARTVNGVITLNNYISLSVKYENKIIMEKFYILKNQKYAYIVGRTLLKKLNYKSLFSEQKTFKHEYQPQPLSLMKDDPFYNRIEYPLPVIVQPALTKKQRLREELDILNIDHGSNYDKYSRYELQNEKKYDTNITDNYVDQLLVGAETSESALNELQLLLYNTQKVVAKAWNDVGVITDIQFEINLKSGAIPFRMRPYKSSYVHAQEIKRQFDLMTEAGFTRRSKSNYATALVIVIKPDGTLRVCPDYSSLNLQTIKDRYPIPSIADLLSKLAGRRWFTILDLRHWYHHIAIKPADIHKTAVITAHGLYEYCRMTFGFCNAPATFQRCMDSIFHMLSYVLIYLDDILISSSSELEHMEHIRVVIISLWNETETR